MAGETQGLKMWQNRQAMKEGAGDVGPGSSAGSGGDHVFAFGDSLIKHVTESGVGMDPIALSTIFRMQILSGIMNFQTIFQGLKLPAPVESIKLHGAAETMLGKGG